MLERPSTAEGQLEVSEVEIDGWARSCGEIPVRQSDGHLPSVLFFQEVRVCRAGVLRLG